jgi:hypothetical protein
MLMLLGGGSQRADAGDLVGQEEKVVKADALGGVALEEGLDETHEILGDPLLLREGDLVVALLDLA